MPRTGHKGAIRGPKGAERSRTEPWAARRPPRRAAKRTNRPVPDRSPSAPPEIRGRLSTERMLVPRRPPGVACWLPRLSKATLGRMRAKREIRRKRRETPESIGFPATGRGGHGGPTRETAQSTGFTAAPDHHETTISPPSGHRFGATRVRERPPAPSRPPPRAARRTTRPGPVRSPNPNVTNGSGSLEYAALPSNESWKCPIHTVSSTMTRHLS